MSTEHEPAISEVQLQQLTSPKLTLWEVQISEDTFAYFHEGLKTSAQSKVNAAVNNSTSVVLTEINPAIVVGQIVTGTGISGTVTVAGISGVNLTLSSAQSPPLGAVLSFEGKITMRDRVTPSTIRTYEPIPISGGGFDFRAEGSSPRPTLTVANVLGSGAGGLLAGISPLTSNKDLLGKKVYRRMVFLKHTYNVDPSSSPPIEFPIQMYFIDRILTEDPVIVSFELVAGFDMEGVKVPRRVVTGTGCPWIYTGAAPERDEEDRVGGCTWSTIGKVTEEDTLANIRTYYNYINSADEPIVDEARVESGNWTASTNVTLGQVWRTQTAPAMNKVNPDGSLTVIAENILFDYWQYTGPNEESPASVVAGAHPSDNSSIWRRVRIHSLTYSGGADYFAYSLSRYNTYVKRNNKVWVASRVSQIGTGAGVHTSAPQHNSYWELGDACSKSITGCALRYRYQNMTYTDTDLISPKQGITPLQFGGFPASRKF